MKQRFVAIAAVASLAALASPAARAQSHTRSCTAKGPAAIPSEVVPGLRDGPHTLIVDGVRLWYCVAGNGTPGIPPVIFLHGGPGQGSYHFAALSGSVLEPSLRLVYFDQRGSGRSERPWTGDYSLPTLIEDIEALRRALGVSQIALIAHSFAGALALEYAAKYPERVSRMVIFDGISDVPASGRSQCERLAAVNPAAYARSAANGKAPVDPGECSVTRALSGRELTAFFRASMFPDSTIATRLDSVYAASGLRNTGELSAALFNKGGMGRWRFAAYERLAMPVLVIAGRHDYQVGLEPQRELARKLPNGRLLVYDESGHYPNLDEPARFARDVIAFLAESAAGTRR
jgi:proline iminopeptidase